MRRPAACRIQPVPVRIADRGVIWGQRRPLGAAQAVEIVHNLAVLYRDLAHKRRDYEQ